jgi:hypothetical protein
MAFLLQYWKQIVSFLVAAAISVMGLMIQHKNADIVKLKVELEMSQLETKVCSQKIVDQNKAVEIANKKLKDKQEELNNAEQAAQDLDEYYRKQLIELRTSLTGTMITIPAGSLVRKDSSSEVNIRWENMLKSWR